MDRMTESGARPLSAESERRRENARSARLVAVFLLGCVGFVAPLLRVVSRPPSWGAWPMPFVFLFAFWAVLIALIALAQRSRRGD
jgi:hypothetical protein